LVCGISPWRPDFARTARRGVISGDDTSTGRLALTHNLNEEQPMMTASSMLSCAAAPRMFALAASALALALGAASAARASDADEYPVPSVVVRYDDLNLANKQGTLILYERIRTAASTVCDLTHGTKDLALVALQRACEAQAIDRAVHQIHSAQLAQLHANRKS
jgi:UrcA family protein